MDQCYSSRTHTYHSTPPLPYILILHKKTMDIIIIHRYLCSQVQINHCHIHHCYRCHSSISLLHESLISLLPTGRESPFTYLEYLQHSLNNTYNTGHGTHDAHKQIKLRYYCKRSYLSVSASFFILLQATLVVL